MAKNKGAAEKKSYLSNEMTSRNLTVEEIVGIEIEELTPYAIDVLWNEIQLGRYLRDMKKNKGGGDKKSEKYHQSIQTTSDIPTVEEIVGSKDKSSLLQKVAKFSDEVIQDYIELCIDNKLLPKSGDLKNKNTTISKMTGDNE